MLIIFTGNGKGKTTAALGQAFRAVGDDKRVLMVQFIKGPWKSGEDEAHKKLLPKFKIVKMGKGFVGILGDTLPRKVHAQAATQGLEFARTQAHTKKWDIIILDEIWNALSLKLLSKKSIIACINEIKPLVEQLIMTGRDCPQFFINKADLVTEMRDIKHPFSQGVQAKKGVEF